MAARIDAMSAGALPVIRPDTAQSTGRVHPKQNLVPTGGRRVAELAGRCGRRDTRAVDCGASRPPSRRLTDRVRGVVAQTLEARGGRADLVRRRPRFNLGEACPLLVVVDDA